LGTCIAKPGELVSALSACRQVPFERSSINRIDFTI
jgi:hypothetical protein